MALAKSQRDGSGYSILDEALESMGQKPLVPKARPRVYQGAVAKSMAASSMAVPKAFVPSVGGAMTPRVAWGACYLALWAPSPLHCRTHFCLPGLHSPTWGVLP